MDPGLRWSVQSIGNLLNQWSYIGYKEVNKQNKNIDQEALKSWEKYSVVKASWPAILDEESFREAQRMLDEAGEMERARLSIAEERVFLVSGLMTCGHCGRALVGSASHSERGEIYRYYKHSRTFHAHPCSQPRVRAEELEGLLIKSVGTALKTAGYFENLEKRLKAASKAQTPEAESEVKRVSKRLAEIEERISGIMQFQRTGKLGPEALELISEELNGLAREKSAVRAYIGQIRDQTTTATEIPSQTNFVKERMQDLAKGWQKAPVSTKKRLLRRLIKSIVVTDTDVAVTFWLAADSQGAPILEGTKGPLSPNQNVIRFGKKSSENSDQNLLGNFAPLGKIGSGGGT